MDGSVQSADLTAVSPMPANAQFANQTGMAGVINRYKALPEKNRMAILVGIPILLALIVSLFMWMNNATYKVLFSGVTDQDGGAIVASLNQMKVPYKYGVNGSTILVPEDKVYDARLALASQGLPKGNIVGFEAMDNQALGVTQFQEQVNYQRSLEGELSRSIQALAAVQTARVHLALPKPSVFVRSEQKASASVVVSLYSGRALTKQQVNGIVHLVSSSVSNMSAADVSVVDQSGNLLTAKNEDGVGGATTTQLAYANQIEQQHASRIVEVLTPLFGAENIKATVTAKVDFTRKESTTESFRPNSDPTAQTIRSQQTMESNDSNGGNPSGAPGVLSNTPPSQANAPIGGNPQALNPFAVGAAGLNGQPTSSRKEGTINYEVDKSVTVKQDQIGNVSRLTAAVVVNYKTITDKRGDVKEVPLTADEIANVENLVKQAIGAEDNELRRDVVTVINQPFTKAATAEIPVWRQEETIAMAKAIGMPLAVAVVIAVLVFGIFRPLIKPADEATEVDALMESGFSTQPEMPLLATAGNDEDDRFMLERSEETLRMEEQRSARLELLRDTARENPELLANLLRNWVGNAR
jgi:flagellar M-ring protein FliF